jgi:predicted dehydrogenase
MGWDDEIVYTDAGPTRTMAPRPKETLAISPLPDLTGDWTEYYRYLVGALAGTQALIVTPEQGLRVMRVVDAAFESVRSGQSVGCRI